MRDTRESGEMLECALAAGVTEAGGDALLGRRPADAGGAAARAPPRPADGGRHLGFAQPLRGQRDQALRLRRLQARRRHRGRDRGFARPAARRCPPTSAGSAPLDDALEDYLRALQSRFGALDLTGRRILLDCANGATYRAAPEIFARLGRRRRGHGRRAGRLQHQRRVRLDPPRGRGRARRGGRVRRRRSPSTATATASWPSTATGRSSTATSSSPWPRCTSTPATGCPGAAWRSRS